MSVQVQHIEPLLADVMNAQACGRAAHRALLDLAAVVVRLPLPAETRHALLDQVRLIARLGAEQAEHHRRAAGCVDELVRTGRHRQLNGDRPYPLTVKEIGRRLRPALAVLRDEAAHTALEVASARRVVGDVLAAVPASRLFTSSVEKELRAAGYRLLWQQHGQSPAGEVAA
jgi:hypothetical protein